MTPRGLRNNNPGNLRLSGDRWKGLRPVQTDKEFFQFTDMRYGYRAMLITLRNYRKKHGLKTLSLMIGRYARPRRTTPAHTFQVYAASFRFPLPTSLTWMTRGRCAVWPPR